MLCSDAEAASVETMGHPPRIVLLSTGPNCRDYFLSSCQNLVIRCLFLYGHIIYASVHEPLSEVECRISVKGETLTRGSLESEMSPLSRAEYSRKSSGAVCLRVADATVYINTIQWIALRCVWGGGGMILVVCFSAFVCVCVFLTINGKFRCLVLPDYISGESANTNKINYLGILSSDVK